MFLDPEKMFYISHFGEKKINLTLAGRLFRSDIIKVNIFKTCKLWQCFLPAEVKVVKTFPFR